MPKEDDVLGNQMTEKDMLDVVHDYHVGSPDTKIESKPAIRMAYFGLPHGTEQTKNPVQLETMD